MTDYAQICDGAVAALSTLAQEGIAPTPAEVVRLSYLAWQIETPEVRLALSRGRPVKAGNAWLWPLTVAAATWYESVGCRIGNGRDALAYAMAHSREGYFDGRGAWEVLKWRTALRATDAEIREAMAQIVAQSEEPPKPERESARTWGYGDIVAHCVAVCGGTAEQWETACAMDWTTHMLRTMAAQHAAINGDKTQDQQWLRATLAFGHELNQIRERHKANV